MLSSAFSQPIEHLAGAACACSGRKLQLGNLQAPLHITVCSSRSAARACGTLTLPTYTWKPEIMSPC